MADEPVFLYPHSRQYPFDGVCGQIVRELERRNWRAPGIEVKFDTYRGDRDTYKLVRYLTGDDFHLRFCREQGRLPGGGYNDTAAVTELTIPGRQLHVYADESGPRLYTYVGNDWEADKAEFSNSSKVNSKLRGSRRTYLLYSGGCRCGGSNFAHFHPRRRDPLLLHDNDLGREYDALPHEAKSFQTAEVLRSFAAWLTDNVLARLIVEG